MRKLKLQMQLSLDGFVAGPKGELDWMVWNWDEELKNYVSELTDTIDTIIMGRNLAEGFIPYWKNVSMDALNEQHEFGKIMTDTTKIVFSKTGDASQWGNTTISKADITREVIRLKKQEGKHIMTYGGASFASSLVENNLIDEYHLFFNPSAIGTGLTIFRGLKEKMNLKLVQAKPFDCGVVLFHYQPIHQ